jgi:hypothetical protein
MTVTEEGMSPILLANRVPVVVLGVKYPWACEAFTSNGLSVTVPPAEFSAGVVATGTGGWLAGAWVWSGVAGGVFAVWPKSVAGISTPATSAAQTGRKAADFFAREVRIRFIRCVLGFGWAKRGEKQPTG